MFEVAANSLPQLVEGAFTLDPEAFRQIASLPKVIPALVIVLLAELSLGIGHSIILFINQVKPGRFLFSLLVNAILFTIGFLFLVFSTWLVCQLPGSVNVPFFTLVKVLGFSYAPLLFSFLGALPYLGVPILNVLSIWRLLAMVVGFAAVAGIGAGKAFGYVAVGWFTLQLLENTLGQPIVRLYKTLADRAAGVELVRGRAARERVQTSLWDVSTPMAQATQETLPEVQQFMQAANRSHRESAQTVAQTMAQTMAQGFTVEAASGAASLANPFQNCILQTASPDDPLVQLNQRTGKIPHLVKLGFSLIGMVILFVAIAVLLRPLRMNVSRFFDGWPRILQLLFNLTWIGVVATVFAGLLAPLETLGWWAGWYGDEVETVGTGFRSETANGQALSQSVEDVDISRFIVYLDGIGQSGETYTPDVEEFLDTLEPALPRDMKLIQGLMMYSVLNKPLDQDRPLAFVWRLADKMRFTNPTALLGLFLNLRNVFIVAVSADKRYGPIYNQGIAQVLYDGLIQQGYRPGSGIPITLIGYSGGGEMSVAAAPYLKRAMGAPIEAISLGGVMSANNNFLKLEHLYHLVGDQDSVEQIGPIIYPGRWKIFPLSYWNRAKRKGKITIFRWGRWDIRFRGA